MHTPPPKIKRHRRRREANGLATPSIPEDTMKTKLKSILQNAWHEPRHFFFWLALLSLCGLAFLAISLALIPYEVQKSRPGVLLSFLMLGCMLLFVMSF